MKVLWLAPLSSPNERLPISAPWVQTLAELVAQHPGVELTILNSANDLVNPVSEFDSKGIHYIYLRAPGRRTDILSLYQWRIAIMANYLRQHYREYDLIHVHGSELQYQVATAGLDIPQLLSVQGLVSELVKVVPRLMAKQKLYWKLASYYECKYMPSISHFSCRTHWDKAHIARLNPRGTIHHNWEMLRPEFFAAAAQPPAAPTARPQVLFLNGSQLLKGFREALVAFDLARQRRPELKLVVGGRAVPAEVQQAVHEAGLRHLGPEDVEYRGFLTAEGLAQLSRESMCLLHPSYLDNSPNTICEAQLVGLPVIASNVGGVSSLIEHGQTGMLTDLNPRNLADQLLLLHDDPALRRQLARQAQAVAHERHDPATVLQKTLDIYHAIL